MEPSRKQLVTLACGGRGGLGLLVSKKRTSSISFQRWQPIFFALCNGAWGLPRGKLVPHVLELWRLDNEFANSIELTLIYHLLTNTEAGASLQLGLPIYDLTPP